MMSDSRDQGTQLFLHRYKCKVVRDLIWTASSPQLLHPDHFPVLPDRYGAQLLRDHRVITWIDQLDLDPTPIYSFLQDKAENKSRQALGVYFSSLLEFWLRHCPAISIKKIDVGKKIVTASNRTVGQLKLVFQGTCSEDQEIEYVHLESSVKFFLLQPDSSTLHTPVMSTDKYLLEQFIGPHLGENLAWRVQEVKRKLGVAQSPNVHQWLAQNYSVDLQSNIVLRGYLFYPLDALTGQQLHPSIAPNHLCGWWTSDLTDFQQHFQPFQLTSKFVVLPKLHWLSPAVASATGHAVVLDDDNTEAITYASPLDEFCLILQNHFQVEVGDDTDVIMPLLVAQLEVACDGKWREKSRGFVLDPQSWTSSYLSSRSMQYNSYTDSHDGQQQMLENIIVKGDGDMKQETGNGLQWNNQEFKYHPDRLISELEHVLNAPKSNRVKHSDVKQGLIDLLAVVDSEEDADTFPIISYVAACLRYLRSETESDVRSNLRVGHLLLEAYQYIATNGTKRDSRSDLLLLLLDTGDKEDWWPYLKLTTRAMEIVSTEYHKEELSKVSSLVEKLLNRKERKVNAIAIDLLRVLNLNVPMEDVMASLIEQEDWENAESFAIVCSNRADGIGRSAFTMLVKLLEAKGMHKAVHRIIRNCPPAFSDKKMPSSRPDDQLRLHRQPQGPPMMKKVDVVQNQEMIGTFPPLRYVYVSTAADIEQLQTVLHDKLLQVTTLPNESSIIHQCRTTLFAIDCEWRPQFYKQPGEIEDGVSVYQLCVGDVVYVVDVQELGLIAQRPLDMILDTPSAHLIGFSVDEDIKRLCRSFSDVTSKLQIVELRKVAIARGMAAKKVGLSNLSNTVLGSNMSKEEQTSDWGARPLTDDQMAYAASDAFVVDKIALVLLADLETAWRHSSKFMGLHSFLEVCCVQIQTKLKALGRDDVARGLKGLGLQDRCRFQSLSNGQEVEREDGIVVKSLALQVRLKGVVKYCIAVLRLDHVLDTNAIGAYMIGDQAKVTLVNRQTLLDVFGYESGTVGPIGLRKQRQVQVLLDVHVATGKNLLCGGGAINTVYSISPVDLIRSTSAETIAMTK